MCAIGPTRYQLCPPVIYSIPFGSQEEEDRRDYDMHRLAREEKLKGKKLRGKRKRKEIERERAPGQDFRVDVGDERFAAVLEGDTRFGIDRTDTHFKASGFFLRFLCFPAPIALDERSEVLALFHFLKNAFFFVVAFATPTTKAEA